jgi:hypothetical protein
MALVELEEVNVVGADETQGSTGGVLEEARSGVGFMDSVPNVSLGTDVGGVEVSEKDVLGWLTFGKFCCCGGILGRL